MNRKMTASGRSIVSGIIGDIMGATIMSVILIGSKYFYRDIYVK